MALTFDWSKTALDASDDNDRVLADSAVWATIAVGINHITEDNAREWFARISMYEKVAGAWRNHWDGEKETPVFFTAEEVVRLIGLRTNASPKTKAQFNKGLWSFHESYNVPREFPSKP